MWKTFRRQLRPDDRERLDNCASILPSLSTSWLCPWSCNQHSTRPKTSSHTVILAPPRPPKMNEQCCGFHSFSFCHSTRPPHCHKPLRITLFLLMVVSPKKLPEIAVLHSFASLDPTLGLEDAHSCVELKCRLTSCMMTGNVCFFMPRFPSRIFSILSVISRA